MRGRREGGGRTLRQTKVMFSLSVSHLWYQGNVVYFNSLFLFECFSRPATVIAVKLVSDIDPADSDQNLSASANRVVGVRFSEEDGVQE